MNKGLRLLVTCIVLIGIALFSGACKKNGNSPTQTSDSTDNARMDVLEMIYQIADKNDMKVISDVNLVNFAKDYREGEEYAIENADSLIEAVTSYVDKYQGRYGKHKSFWGWYLDAEVNPMKPADYNSPKTVFWRKVWKSTTEECHRVQPGGKVTIAPFFLIMEDYYSQYTHLYMPPSDYTTEWSKLLKETGIDIILLQESGAQHASFFTLAQREPFYLAFAEACKQSGAEFWCDMESAQVVAKDWPELNAMNNNGTRDAHYKVTSIEWLADKLDLAAKYCSNILNWGYFPFQNPVLDKGPWPVRNDGDPKAAYTAYKEYYENVPKNIAPGYKSRPVIGGALWFVGANYDGWTKHEMEQLLEHAISVQKAAGFDFLWIENTARNIAWMEKK